MIICTLNMRRQYVQNKSRWTDDDDAAGLYFEEEFLPVQQVSNEHPQRCSPQALEEPFPVALLETHLPAEGEV